MARGGDVKKVSDLFAKYRNVLRAPEASVIEAFVSISEELLGVVVPKEKLTYNPHTKTLSLRLNGALKSEIKLHEQEIIAHLKGRLGVQNAPKHIV
ncbi:hypothetical protein H6783_01240 [Candidatus Nomurabacteria bacterium]|nr:hypothetical protein [Candidatus Nomurabacteria bacterium]